MQPPLEEAPLSEEDPINGQAFLAKLQQRGVLVLVMPLFCQSWLCHCLYASKQNSQAETLFSLHLCQLGQTGWLSCSAQVCAWSCDRTSLHG